MINLNTHSNIIIDLRLCGQLGFCPQTKCFAIILSGAYFNMFEGRAMPGQLLLPHGAQSKEKPKSSRGLTLVNSTKGG